MAPKGRGRGPCAPPPSCPARPPLSARPKLAACTLADALAAHKFRRTGVETQVTSRADVQASLATYVPSRIRAANASWQGAYGEYGKCGNTRSNVRFAEAVDIFEMNVENGAPVCPLPWSLGAGVAKEYRQSVKARYAANHGPGAADSWPPLPPHYDPDAAWHLIEPSQTFEAAPNVFAAEPGTALPRQAEDHARFVCISDTHGRHRDLTPKLPRGDVLLHSGDFTMSGELDVVNDFSEWLSSLPYGKKIVIAGNHDLCFDPGTHSDSGLGILKSAGGETVEYLADTSTVVHGIRIFGSPWTPEFGTGWAFNLARGPALAARWAPVPLGTDVLLTHGPPLGRGDRCGNGCRVGCADLLAAVQGHLRPAFCVFGHIHEGHGASSDGVTCYVNAASCDENYKCIRPPLVFDLPCRKT